MNTCTFHHVPVKFAHMNGHWKAYDITVKLAHMNGHRKTCDIGEDVKVNDFDFYVIFGIITHFSHDVKVCVSTSQWDFHSKLESSLTQIRRV